MNRTKVVLPVSKVLPSFLFLHLFSVCSIFCTMSRSVLLASNDLKYCKSSGTIVRQDTEADVYEQMHICSLISHGFNIKDWKQLECLMNEMKQLKRRFVLRCRLLTDEYLGILIRRLLCFICYYSSIF